MKLRLLDIPTEETEMVHNCGITAVASALKERGCEDAHPLSFLEVKMRILRIEKKVFARGQILGNMEAICARCLTPFVFPITPEFQQTFLPRTGAFSLEEVELNADTVDTTYYSGEEIDFAPLICDEVILDMPPNPVCRENCRGLCPACGANLNEEACRCLPSAGNPKWEALRKLKV